MSPISVTIFIYNTIVKRCYFTPHNSFSIERTCEANAEGENSSFFTVCLESVPHYFKLAYVLLYVAVKEFFEAHF